MSTTISPQGLPDLASIKPQLAAGPQAGGFGSVLENVNGILQQADQLAAGYAQGKIGLTDAVLASDQADTAFQLVIGVRNRALAAYQEIANLQV